MTLVQFLLVSLSVWRVAHFFADPAEDGPFSIAHRVRKLVGVKYDDYSNPYGTNVVSKAILCVWCGSFWYGVLAALVYWALTKDINDAVWLPLATSGFSVLAEEYVTRDS